MVTVVLDPGHGGDNHGVIINGIVEKDLNLSLANDLADSLAGVPINVAMTRNYDISMSLQERGELAKSYGADFVLSIHINANPNPTIHGAEGFYVPNDAVSLGVATHISECAPIRLRSGRVYFVTDTDWRYRAYNVLKPYKDRGIPSALAECGYASNMGDADYLLDQWGRQQMVCALRAGVIRAVQGLEATTR